MSKSKGERKRKELRINKEVCDKIEKHILQEKLDNNNLDFNTIVNQLLEEYANKL